MNIAQNERSERVFSSTGQSGLTSDNAKFFANPVQSESTYRKVFGNGHTPEMDVNGAGDFRRFAFKALPVCGAEGLWLSAHLDRQGEVFEQVWSIFTEAFTGFERRTRREQMSVMRHPRYRFSAIMHENSVVGVLAWWQLPGFCFVEHFAISSAQRSGGFGRRAMELLQTHVGCPIVMDVEPFGSDHHASRRIAFYNRLGFSYCGASVTLPAYEGKATAPSNLMAWPNALDRAGRERALETIEREIYRQYDSVPYTSVV